MSLEKIWENTKDLHIIEDCMILYKYIIEKKPIQILEIGTGISTLIIAQAIKENNIGKENITPMVSIDIDKVRQDEFSSKLAELNLSNVKLENQNSIIYTTFSCLKESIDFIFLDSSHTFEQTTVEINLLLPLLKKNGCLFLHDTKIGNVITAIYVVLSNVTNINFYEYNTFYGLGALKYK
jgi:predicted O-methyltransferase YrrM